MMHLKKYKNTCNFHLINNSLRVSLTALHLISIHIFNGNRSLYY